MEIKQVVFAILISLTCNYAHECGKKTRNSGFVVFGNQFKHGDFPWIVALKYTGRNPATFFCGGTLVSLQHVITAAHCMNPKYGEGGAIVELVPRDILALFGAYDLGNANEVGRITLSPEKILVHNDWNPQVRSYDADIAILKFADGEISIKPNILPICLWESSSAPTATHGIVAGWGRSEDETKSHENIPRWLSIPIRSNDDCFLKTPDLAGLSSKRTFCAGLENGSGVCTGDSGNGFFIGFGGSVFLRGIVSSSRTTMTSCDVTTYAVYTDVIKFRDWISTTIGVMDGNVAEIELRQVSCSVANENWPTLGKTARTCSIENQAIDSENTEIGGNGDSSMQAFAIKNNKNVKYIPKNIYDKFRQLILIQISDTSIESVNDKHFKNCDKLKLLDLSRNELKFISSEAFRDLYDLKMLTLNGNKIKVLPATLLNAMEDLTHFRATENQIREIPSTFFSRNLLLKIIALQNNEIEALHDDTFKNLGELTHLFLISNKIRALNTGLLSSLQKLREFMIFDNRIRILGPKLFDSTPNIVSLNLGDNNIKTLDENIFSKLPQLEYLAIPNNQFEVLPQNIFRNNLKLKKIWLHGNEIKSLTAQTFENLSMLEYVDLQNNVCVGGFYYVSQLASMKNEITKGCSRP